MALVTAKVIAVAVAGAALSALTFGVGLAAAAELSAHGLHHLPADTASMLAGSMIAGTLFGVIGVALGYLTRRTVAPQQLKWLVSGAASDLTPPVVHGTAHLSPAAAAVLGGYALVLLAAAARLVLRRDVA